jgi:His-Xaa-Ser system protein HxsD
MLTVLDRAHIAIRLDPALYSVAAVFRAAYKLTDRCYILIDRQDDHLVAFIIGRTPTDDVTELVGAFSNDLIDQQLRERLETQFGSLRTIIAAQAFAEGNLLRPVSDDDAYNQDPHGIAKPR